MKLELADKSDEAFEHVMPLQPQAVEVLRALHRLSGRWQYVVGGVRSARTPMSENTISYMYARNGYSGRHVPHGWRSTFSTIMNERAVKARRAEDRAIIDGMLAHKPKGVSATEMAYNRAPLGSTVRVGGEVGRPHHGRPRARVRTPGPAEPLIPALGGTARVLRIDDLACSAGMPLSLRTGQRAERKFKSK